MTQREKGAKLYRNLRLRDGEMAMGIARLRAMVIAGLAATGSAAAQPVVVNPDWIHKPTPQELGSAWPAEATKQGLTQGRAMLVCQVMTDGKLSKCTAQDETPVGAGFGEAAVKMAGLMLMRPKMVDGKAVDGAEVRVPINFTRPLAPAPAAFDVAPDWLKKPTIDQVIAAYPREAMTKGVSGKATITCAVNLQGLLQECRVIQEEPKDLGFGVAAVVLSSSFLMKPAQKDGRPVMGVVTVPINFKSEGKITSNNTDKLMILSGGVWSQTPTVPEILAVIDKKVGDKFAEGKVVLQCDLDRRTGKLSECNLFNAAPQMAQFTSVAKALTSKFRADPTSLTAIKDRIRVNLAFSFPDMQSPAWSERYITRPKWVRTVNPEPGQSLFPAEAVKAGLKVGQATEDCVVSATGALTNCQTVSESSPNVGFGDMAKQIAEAFATNPWTDEGLPTDGAHIRMPITMKYDPSLDKAPDTAPAPTPATKP